MDVKPRAKCFDGSMKHAARRLTVDRVTDYDAPA
jgi:hypothetical protein